MEEAGPEALRAQGPVAGVGGAEWDMSAPISAEDIAKAGGSGSRWHRLRVVLLPRTPLISRRR